eukprot:48452-Rhodomonas_salina.1
MLQDNLRLHNGPQPFPDRARDSLLARCGGQGPELQAAAAALRRRQRVRGRGAGAAGGRRGHGC